MSPRKKIIKKIDVKNIKSIVSKNINLDKLKVNPINAIDIAKNKITNFYNNLKKQREKDKKRLEKKRILDEKKNYNNKKKKLREKD